MQKIILNTIKGRKHFTEIFETGTRYNYKDIAAIIIYNKNSDFEKCESETVNNEINDNEIYNYNLNYAVSVGKRISKRAVFRNRMKRLMREALRASIKDSFKFETLLKIESIVFLWRKKPETSNIKEFRLKDVSILFDGLFSKIYKNI